MGRRHRDKSNAEGITSVSTFLNGSLPGRVGYAEQDHQQAEMKTDQHHVDRHPAT